MTPISFAVHSYNEGAALRRMILSSLPFKAWIAEWIVLDHRSDDDTQAVIDELAGTLAAAGIPLIRLHEERDLSARFTFADLRNRVLDACHGPLVAIQDADFIFGTGYESFLKRAVPKLLDPAGPYFSASYAIPVIWDHLVIDESGTITDHGRVWVHNRKPRILDRRSMRYAQTGSDGRWERPSLTNRRREKQLTLSPGRHGLVAHTCVSVNVKPAERIALRDTMTLFMQDAVRGKTSGTWLEDYAAGKARKQDAYPYMPVNLRGWKLFAESVELSHAA